MIGRLLLVVGWPPLADEHPFPVIGRPSLVIDRPSPSVFFVCFKREGGLIPYAPAHVDARAL